MINPYLLEQLLAFYRTGTLSAAAEELFISQPALSQSMQKLEELVGVPLFIRQKNKTSFNENGRLMATYAEKILALQSEMVETVRHQALHQDYLAIGSIAPGPLMLLEPALQTYFPNLNITIELLEKEEELLDGLQNGQFDLIISHERVEEDNLQVIPYLTETLYMRIPAKHPLAEKSSLTVTDLSNQNILILSDIGFWMPLMQEKIPTANYLYMDNSDAFTDIANMGSFPTFISDLRGLTTSDDYTVVPIDEPLATAHFSFVIKKEQYYKGSIS